MRTILSAYLRVNTNKNIFLPRLSLVTPLDSLRQYHHANNVQVSRHAPVGYVITRVFANDADWASNARLSFHIVSGNGNSLFDVDPALGTISISADLRQSTADRHDLLVAVSDAGAPPKSATVLINVILTTSSWLEQANRQIADDNDDRAGYVMGSLFEIGRHRFIVILLGIVTTLIVTALLSAIVCVKCQRVC